MATTSNGQAGGLYLPTQKTIGNKEVMPVTSTLKQELKPEAVAAQQKGDVAGGGLLGIASTGQQQSVKPAAMASSATPTSGQSISVTQPVKPSSPEFNYESNGYTGVQGATDKQYDPRSESLVQNQLSGLLDPNSALMKRAISQTQEQAASRGLQSSSIAAGAGMGAMIDRALPIAQQDAQTYGNAQQLGWQNNFAAEQNNLSRQHDANMFDKNAEFQAQMSDLQYRQQLGTLDYQGQQQLQQMERSAQLTQQRDQLLQQFQSTNMDKDFLNNLQMKQVEFQQQDSMFEKQVGAQAAMDYRNSAAAAYNNYLEQVAAVYSNPNMTPEQQAAGVAKLQQMFEAQRIQLQTIYGIVGQPGSVGGGGGTDAGSGSNTGGNTGGNMGVVNPVNPPGNNQVQYTPTPAGGGMNTTLPVERPVYMER